MALATKEWRHLLLLTGIVAALPLLVFPHSLGLNLKLSFALYVILELVYFFVVFRLLNPGSDGKSGAVGMLLSLCGRLLLSATFWIYLMLFDAMRPGLAFGQSFFNYKPGLLLFTLVAPVLYNSAIVLIASKNTPSRKRVRRPATMRHRETTAVTINELPRPIAPSAPRAVREAEPFGSGFDNAVRHVGEYSGVLCALLIDSEGLPIASFDRHKEDLELWSGLTLKLLEDFQETLAKADADDLNWLEFAYNGKRCYLLPVRDMWLLSIANAAADELEKIRMQQAAVMVQRYYDDRYQSQSQTLTENSYAGSTVGA